MNLPKVLFVLLTLFGAAGLAHVSADTFTPAPLFGADKVHAKRLPNGVQTIVHNTPGSGAATLQVWVEAGSRFETESTNGATYLIEMLAMQGSKNYPTETDGHLSGPQSRLEALGGQVSSLTSRDDVFWSVTLAPSGLPQAMKILADAILEPDLSDPSVAAAKTIAASDWVQNRVDPIGFVSDLAYEKAFSAHPYRKSVQGDLKSINMLTGDSVRAYYKERFTGSHLHVVIAGDVDVSTTTALAESTFGKAPKTSKPDTPIPPATALKGIQKVTQRGVLPIQVVTLAWRSPSVKVHKDAVAADVLLTYLNEGSNAALRQALQKSTAEKKESDSTSNDSEDLAGGFSADYLTQRDSGLFLINIIAPKDIAQATAAVRQLMADAGAGVQADALNDAKTALRRQYITQAENSAGQAGGLGFYDAIDSYQFAIDYLDLVQQITNEDIIRVAQKYFSLDNYVEVTLLPALDSPRDDGGSGIVASLPSSIRNTATGSRKYAALITKSTFTQR